jgi:hypothetical protein
MKKQISLLLVLIILLSSTVYADSEHEEYLSVLSSLKTISIEDVPENIEPLEFDTDEEFEEYLKKSIISNKNKVDDEIGVTKLNKLPINNSFSNTLDRGPIYEGNYTGSHKTNIVAVSGCYLNLKTLFHYERLVGPDLPGVARYNFLSSTASMSLSGITVGIEITDINCSSTVASNKGTISTIGTCTLNHYFLINGLIKIYSEDKTLRHTVYTDFI